MTNQYPSDIQHLANAILTTSGDTESNLRYTVEARAAQLDGRLTTENMAEVPAELIRYIDKIAQYAYKVTDTDIDALCQASPEDFARTASVSHTRSYAPVQLE